MNNRIKQVRQLNHLTQDVFASRLGITKSSVSLIESGKNNPSSQTIKLICTEFGIRREWLELGLEPMREEQLADDPAMLVPDLMDTLSAYPAVLDLFRRVVKHMTPTDWARLDQLLDDVQNKNP